MNHIKNYIDTTKNVCSIWIANSQRQPIIDNAVKIFANDASIIDLQTLSSNEIDRVNYRNAFLSTRDELFRRLNYFSKKNLNEIYQHIWEGNMPALYNGSKIEWQGYYASYVQSLINFDVLKILQINDELNFSVF